jgi:hypothetical protein
VAAGILSLRGAPQRFGHLRAVPPALSGASVNGVCCTSGRLDAATLTAIKPGPPMVPMSAASQQNFFNQLVQFGDVSFKSLFASGR